MKIFPDSNLRLDHEISTHDVEFTFGVIFYDYFKKLFLVFFESCSNILISSKLLTNHIFIEQDSFVPFLMIFYKVGS